MHFPADRPEDWYRQLVSETKVTRYKDGVPYSKFENPSKARNEALDMRVYAAGALHLLNVNWKRLKLAILPPAPKEEPASVPGGALVAPPPQCRPRRGGGFVGSW